MESNGGKPFECPYCFFVITVSDRHSWIRHVFRDLMPYICVFPDCPISNRLYESRREWFHHLQTRHLSGLVPGESTDCPLHCGARGPAISLARHLGKHLQELALFVLPSIVEDDGQDSDGTHRSTPNENIGNSISTSSSGDEEDDEVFFNHSESRGELEPGPVTKEIESHSDGRVAVEGFAGELEDALKGEVTIAQEDHARRIRDVEQQRWQDEEELRRLKQQKERDAMLPEAKLTEVKDKKEQEDTRGSNTSSGSMLSRTITFHEGSDAEGEDMPREEEEKTEKGKEKADLGRDDDDSVLKARRRLENATEKKESVVFENNIFFPTPSKDRGDEVNIKYRKSETAKTHRHYQDPDYVDTRPTVNTKGQGRGQMAIMKT